MKDPLAAQLTYCTEAPAEWKIQKLKRLFSVSSGDFLAPEDETSEGFPVYGGNGIRGFASMPNCHGRTLLIGRVGAYCGNVHLVDGDFWYSEHALRVFPIKAFSLDFFKYLIRVIDLNKFANRTAQPLINSGTTTDRYAALPPLVEQRRIAAYLDASCAAIDAAVAAKRRQLETLENLASSILLHSLTIGLCQDIETRTTGASVLPHIPVEWRFGRLKSVAAIRYGLGQPPAELSSGVAMIRATDVDAGTIRTDKLLRVDPDELPPDRNPYLRAGEIIVVRSGAYTGDSAIVPAELEGTVAGYDMIVTVTRASARFIAYCLLSRYVLEGQLLLLTLRAAQPHLNAEELGSVLLALPPTLKEQEAIADHLDVKLAEVKAIVTGIQAQIATLTAYRKSLIHECVTGQRRVG